MSLTESYEEENVTSFTRIFHLSSQKAQNFFLLQTVKILLKKNEKVKEINKNEMAHSDLAVYTVRIFFSLLSEKWHVRMDIRFLFSRSKNFLDLSYLSNTWIFIVLPFFRRDINTEQVYHAISH